MNTRDRATLTLSAVAGGVIALTLLAALSKSPSSFLVIALAAALTTPLTSLVPRHRFASALVGATWCGALGLILFVGMSLFSLSLLMAGALLAVSAGLAFRGSY